MLDEREARRRKIAERGTDRMALITGRVQNIAPTPPYSPSSSSSCSTFSSLSDQSPLPPLPDRAHFRHKTEGDIPVKATMEHTTSSKFSRGNAFKRRTKTDVQLPKIDTNVSKIPAQNYDEKPLIVTPKAPKIDTNVSKIPAQKSFEKNITLFTAKEVNSCIVATESTRVFCSVVIALLVVLSNVNLPHTIVKSTSTIASRPLYILLLSDVTIVILKLLQKRKDFEHPEEEDKIVQLKDGPSWVGAVQILEVGLVFYQSIRGLFIDVSCYTVVVICGLCLV